MDKIHLKSSMCRAIFYFCQINLLRLAHTQHNVSLWLAQFNLQHNLVRQQLKRAFQIKTWFYYCDVFFYFAACAPPFMECTSFFHTQVTTHWFNTPVRVEYLMYALVPKSNHADATKGLSVKTSKHLIGSLDGHKVSQWTFLCSSTQIICNSLVDN